MAFDVKAARVVAARTCYREAAVREWLSNAVAEIERLRAFLPDPESCSGWDDAGAPEDVALDLANLAGFKGVAEATWPAHILAAAKKSANQ